MIDMDSVNEGTVLVVAVAEDHKGWFTPMNEVAKLLCHLHGYDQFQPSTVLRLDESENFEVKFLYEAGDRSFYGEHP